MKILYLTIFHPQNNKVDNIYTMLVQELIEQGHSITVVVAEESKSIDKTCLRYEKGIEVLRVRVGNQFGVNAIHKGITTLKLEPLLINGIKKYLSEKAFDVVLYATPPVTLANVVRFCRQKYGCRSYLMLKDIFPQNAVDIGLMNKNSMLYRAFRRKELKLYQQSDFIGCMSPENINYLLQHNDNLDSGKVELFPNTIKVKPPFWEVNLQEVRKIYSIPEDSTVFIFGGNIGLPQGVDFLIDCVKQLENYDRAFFLIVGDGTERRKIEDLIRRYGLTNILVLGRLLKTDYDSLTAASDVGLVLLDKRFTIPNYPSRILSYMEMSLPVLAATDMVSDIRNLLSEAECGLWAYSGDTKGFMDQVKILCENPGLRIQMGMNGRSYLEKNFDVSRSVQILESHFGLKQ